MEQKMEELNRDEIVKALECCIKTQCENCCNLGNWHEQWNCMTDLMRNALTLINQLTEDNTKLANMLLEKDVIILEQGKFVDENERLKTELRQTAQKLKAVEEVNEKLTDENERLQDLVKEVQEYNENWVADNGRLRGILLQFTDIVHKWGNKNGYDTSEISLVSILNEESGIKKQIEADTVRELQTRLAQYIGTYTEKSFVYVSAMFKLIDQIAKEMVEG